MMDKHHIQGEGGREGGVGGGEREGGVEAGWEVGSRVQCQH